MPKKKDRDRLKKNRGAKQQRGQQHRERLNRELRHKEVHLQALHQSLRHHRIPRLHQNQVRAAVHPHEAAVRRAAREVIHQAAVHLQRVLQAQLLHMHRIL